MNFYITEMKVFHNERGRVARWAGPVVFAIDYDDAASYCKVNAPHIRVVGKFVQKIDEHIN